ncbi:MAG: sulfatase [Acidobacteriota bacterium]|nr:sulfatase [Acidobacteriota bacterium]
MRARKLVRTRIMMLVTLVTLTVTTPGSFAARRFQRPNVLLVTIDDLSTDLSIYRNREVVSPHFKRLASRSMRFDRAYTQFPTCNPSRTSMLTGLRPGTTGILDNTVFFRTLLPDVVTLPQFFRQRGYFTMNIGKTFHGVGDKSWDDLSSWDISITPGGRNKWRSGEGRNLTNDKIAWARWVASDRPDADHPDGRVASAAVSALEELHSTAEPFFLAVGFQRPHSPFIAPKRYFDLYDLAQLELRDPPAERSDNLPSATTKRDARIFRRMQEGDRREFLRAYYACVSFIDQQLGLLLDTLDRLDAWDDTIVVVTSDHGFHLGEHEWWGKNTVYEPSNRVPLIIYAPGVPLRRHRSRRMIELVDIYPTLVELAGWVPSAELEGRSLVPLLEKPVRPWSKASFSQVKRKKFDGVSLRTKRWRYSEWNAGENGVELYDHSNDPGEYANLATLPEYGAVVRQLEELLRSVFPDN